MFYTEAIKRTWVNSPYTKLKELFIYGFIILGLITAVILFFGCLPMILGIAFMGWQKKSK
jgi:hypothetical protein